MGFFKDVNKLSKMGKELQRNSDPVGDMQRATQQMAAMNQQMAAANAMAADPADAVAGTVQVVAPGPTVGMLNLDPLMQLQLLVLVDGLPPRPVDQQLLVPMAHVGRIQPGASLPARISRSDPSVFVIDWNAPAA